MAKLFSVCFLLIFFLSCNKTECGAQSNNKSNEQSTECTPGQPEIPGEVDPAPEPEPEPEPELEPEPQPEPEPTPGDELPREAYLFDVNAELYKFARADEEKVRAAFELIKKVIGTTEFRDRVLNHTYKGEKTFHQNNKRSNAEIYQMVLDGKEILLPVVDNRMNLELELYTSSSSTVGYTYPSALRIYLNTKYFNQYTTAEVAGNLFHEWVHKIGFTHDSSNTAGRSSTVPYALGYIMRDLGKKYQ